MSPNYYKILGIKYESSFEDIRRAYHGMALKFHPDKNPSPNAARIFRVINKAYRELIKRRRNKDTIKKTTKSFMTSGADTTTNKQTEREEDNIEVGHAFVSKQQQRILPIEYHVKELPTPTPSNSDEEQEGVYHVEKIVGYDPSTDKYQVKWKGYSSRENTWEPIEHLKYVINLVDAFRASKNYEALHYDPNVPVGAPFDDITLHKGNWTRLDRVFKDLKARIKADHMNIKINMEKPKVVLEDTLFIFSIGCHAYGGLFAANKNVLYLYDGSNTTHSIVSSVKGKLENINIQHLKYAYPTKADLCASAIAAASVEIMKMYRRNSEMSTIYASPKVRKFYEKRYHKEQKKSVAVEHTNIREVPRAVLICSKCNKSKKKKGFANHQKYCKG